ncbi:MAG: sulfatase-like hydrolase/transferase [Fuerstiella sp.]
MKLCGVLCDAARAANIRTVFPVALTLVMLALASTTFAAARPNIILFVTDDQVKEELACYGGKVLTPHIDRLAREGLRFDNAHVPSTVCTPSRYTLLTGRLPGNSYFKSYLAAHPHDTQGNPGFNVGLEDDNMNVGSVLRESGYVTGLVGKLHVGPELKKREDYEAHGLYYPDPEANPDSPEVIAGWQRNERWFREWVTGKGFSWAKHNYWANIKAPYNRHNAEWTLEAALEFIEENREQPFYLHYTTTLMHGGGRAWSESMNHPLASGAGKLEKLPGVIPSRDDIRSQVKDAGYEQNTVGFTWMDATVGAMLEQLDRLGIADNTLFVFVSDHGTEGKWTLHDHNGTAVPCIMRWPKVIPPGTVNSSLIQTTDFVPTFFDIAGAKTPTEYRVDGVSLSPVLSDPTREIHDHLFFELGNARGVRTDDWKYIAVRYETEQFRRIQSADLLRLPRALAYIGNDKTLSNHLGQRPQFLDSDQLYHLAVDPLETTNLAGNAEYFEQLNHLKRLLTSQLEAQGRPFGEFIPGPDTVPTEKIQPYLRKLRKLKPIKRGFEIVGQAAVTTDAAPAGLTRQERKQLREKRKQKRHDGAGNDSSQ